MRVINGELKTGLSLSSLVEFDLFEQWQVPVIDLQNTNRQVDHMDSPRVRSEGCGSRLPEGLRSFRIRDFAAAGNLAETAERIRNQIETMSAEP
ncbi:MAG: hypothetical protein MK106_12940 [Mariniblastus sp.]|nr:hypothetical protein [Mariniblastus sp.]